MSLLETLQNDLKTAMKARDKARLSTIRMLITDLKNERIKSGQDLTEADELSVLSRQAKQRRESIEAYKKGGRPELAAAEQSELTLIEEYLPKQLSEQEVKEMIREVIAQVKPTSKKDFGRVMGALMPKLKGKFPGKQVKPLVEAELDL